MDDKQINSRRRVFLTAATAGTALAAAVLATRRQEIVQEAVAPAPAPVEPETGVGYHETEHIRNYYATAAYF